MDNLISKLDKFPHIQYRIELFWGTKECRPYLKSLTVSDRPSRVGFPFEVGMAIYELIDLHDSEYPEYNPVSHSQWSDCDKYNTRHSTRRTMG